jgi:hypothetical protein
MPQIYNPYKMFVGSFIPNWLLERSEISPGAKLCFARLAQYAGKNGKAFPAQETLGNALGTSARNVRRYLKELEEHRLIRPIQHGMNQPNSYEFLLHDWMAESEDVVRTGADGFVLSERTDSSCHERTDSSSPLEENHIRESGKRIKNRRGGKQPSDVNESENISTANNPEPHPKPISIPEWIDRETWQDFISMRKSKKTDNTPRALSMILKRLTQFREGGHDPNVILENSVMNGWKGVFEPKGKPQSKYANHPAVMAGVLSEKGVKTAQNAAELMAEMRGKWKKD